MYLVVTASMGCSHFSPSSGFASPGGADESTTVASEPRVEHTESRWIEDLDYVASPSIIAAHFPVGEIREIQGFARTHALHIPD